MIGDFDGRIPLGVIAVALLALGIGGGSLLVRDSDPTVTPAQTAQPSETPYTPIKFHEVQSTGGVTYVLTPLVTRWVTYPAPTETVSRPDADAWQPTAQAPGLSTLHPWQTPYPTLICVTNCE